MGLDEVTQMIDFRWRVASGNQDHPFEPEALHSIYLHSEGIPREACVLADNALLLAFLQKKQRITKDIADLAAQDRLDNIGSLKKAVAKKRTNDVVTDEGEAAKEVVVHAEK